MSHGFVKWVLIPMTFLLRYGVGTESLGEGLCFAENRTADEKDFGTVLCGWVLQPKINNSRQIS
jgi:hypothetical protein